MIRRLLDSLTDGQAGAPDTPVDTQAFVIGESDDFDHEIAFTRQNTALMRFLDERAAHAKPGSGTSLEEIRRRLG